MAKMPKKNITTSDKESELLGYKLGKQLRGGEFVDLQGDIGAGKTTFVRGLAAGLDIKEKIVSPTFTISRLYSGRLKLYHYDFYRIRDSFIVESELIETVGPKDGVTVIEWADNISRNLPKDRLIIKIDVIGEDKRLFEFQTFNEQLNVVNL